MKIIEAGGGVLYRRKNHQTEILLIKRNGVWDLPKGKLEPGERIDECAAREVSEEVGIPLPDINSFLCETFHEYVEGEEKVGKKTYWYSMTMRRESVPVPQTEEGITGVLWVDIPSAKEMVGFKNLIKVLDSFIEQFDQ